MYYWKLNTHGNTTTMGMDCPCLTNIMLFPLAPKLVTRIKCKTQLFYYLNKKHLTILNIWITAPQKRPLKYCKVTKAIRKRKTMMVLNHGYPSRQRIDGRNNWYSSQVYLNYFFLFMSPTVSLLQKLEIYVPGWGRTTNLSNALTDWAIEEHAVKLLQN